MTILSAQTIRRLSGPGLVTGVRPLIYPFAEGLLGPDAYDVRLERELVVPARSVALGSTVERFCIPTYMRMSIYDKSTWARRGLGMFNTRAHAGWRGHLTLEAVNYTDREIRIEAGSLAAQVEFEMLDDPTDKPYDGSYQDQESGPQPAKPLRPTPLDPSGDGSYRGPDERSRRFDDHVGYDQNNAD